MGKKFLLATAIVAGAAVGIAAIVAAVEHMKVKRLEDMLDEEFDDFDYEDEFPADTATSETEERSYVKAPIHHVDSESDAACAECKSAAEEESAESETIVDDFVDTDDFLEEEQDAFVDGLDD